VHSGSLTLNTVIHGFGFTIGGYFSGVRTDSAFLTLGPNPPQSDPGYARFDVSSHYEIAHGVMVYARATNLLDRQYQDALGYPALGRDFRAGVRYTLKGRN